MNNYKRLEIIFTNFNNAVYDFYSDLEEFVPPEHKSMILDGLRNTLTNSNLVFKQVADLVFRQKV